MNRKFKHTKGPWWKSTSNEILKMPEQIKISNRIDGSTREESEANARLIVAAPEMIEVCIELFEYLNPNNKHDLTHDQIYRSKLCAIIEHATEMKIEEVLP